MVIKDLSDSQNEFNQDKLKIAPVADRFLAIVIDFLIFSPLVALSLSFIYKSFRLSRYLSSSLEVQFSLWVVLLIGVVSISSILNAFFLSRFGATPGLKYLKLKVVAFEGQPTLGRHDRFISFSQALLRSLLWWGCLLTFGFPFLEIFSHPLRRAIHERASDSIVVTLRNEAHSLPHPIEVRFFTSWLKTFYISLGLLILLVSFNEYTNLNSQLTADDKQVVTVKSCDQLQVEDRNTLNTSKSMDLILATYILDPSLHDCVKEQAQSNLWNVNPTDKTFSQLALGVLSLDKTNDYYKGLCHDKKSEACRISQFLSSEKLKINELLPYEEKGSLTLKVLHLRTSIDFKDWARAISIYEELQKSQISKTYLEPLYIQSVWNLRSDNDYQISGANKKEERQPASQRNSALSKEEYEKIISKFKSRYGFK